MQQTADASVTKDQDADAITILVSGSSYFFYSVEITLGVQAAAVTDVVVTTAACGSSSCYSSVVASATPEVDAVAVATIAATKIYPSSNSFCPGGRSFTYFAKPFHIFSKQKVLQEAV